MPDVKGPGPDRPAGNVFTNKIGPLPMWGWMAIALLVALFYYLYSKNKAGAGASPSTVNTPGGVDASLVPQFVNQTYTNVTPPAAPPMSSPKTTTSQTVNAFSWTDTGQHWTVLELAKHLGISVKALKPSNAEAQTALANPKKPIPKGAKFTYVKEPKGITTSHTNDEPAAKA